MEPSEATVINIQTTSTPSPIHAPANSLFNTFPLTSFIRKFRWRSKYPITPTPVEMSSASRQPALGKYLSPAGLQQLKAYKYVSAPLSSWVDQKMTHYWEWAVKLLPMWVAPNLVTTYSFMHAILAHLLVQYYSPTMGEAAPNWVYAAIAVCMFLYQTFDAIDGKQARRTKNGSPLGQLFDHGCDAVTAWIMGIFIAATLMRGPHLSSFVLMCMVVVPFFAANWEESCTHVFRFGIVGVTEGQFIVMGTELATSIVGPHFWQNPVFPHFFKMDFLPELTIFHCIICVGVIGGVYQVVSSVWTVWHYYESHPNENRRQAIVSFVQYFLHILFGFAWVLAPSDAMLNHPRIIMVTIGLLGSYQASRLIICHTTGEHYPLWFAIMWPLPFVVLNEWSGRLFHGKDHDLWFDQTLVGWAYLGYILALYIHFVHVTINQITTFLGIKCFKIKTHQAEH